MYFKLIFLLLFFSSYLAASNVPSFVTIQHKEGILIRESGLGKKSKSVGVVHYLYSYPVIDAKTTYVKVLLLGNKQGWVYVGGQRNEFVIDGNQLTSIVSYDVSVKDVNPPYDSIGVVKAKQTVSIVDRWYGRLKVRTPDKKEGWIFNGSYQSPWTSSIETEDVSHHYIADFTRPEVVSNMDISSKLVEHSKNNHAYRFFMANESELTATFTLSHRPQQAVLVLTHDSALLENGIGSASISVKINDNVVVAGLTPSGLSFQSDLIHISKWLRLGSNTIDIELGAAKTHYLLKSIALRY